MVFLSVVDYALCPDTLLCKSVLFGEGLDLNILILLAARFLVSYKLINHLSLTPPPPTHVRLKLLDQLDKNSFQNILWLLLRINFFFLLLLILGFLRQPHIA